VELLTLFFESADEIIESGVKLLQFQQRRQAHRGGKNIVGRLAVVDVIVGMDVLVLATRAAQQFRGAISDDLVAVHMEADARARLEDVDHEVLVPLALLNFLGGFDDRVGGPDVDQTELAIGKRSRFFHHGDGANERGMSAQSADGKVVHRARRLDAVVGVGRNFLVSERILLGAGGFCGLGWHAQLLYR